MILNEKFCEGDVVIIPGEKCPDQPGWIMKYHARGERELDMGLVWLTSGKYLALSIVPSKLRECMQRIESFKEVSRDASFDVVRAFLRRSHPNGKKIRAEISSEISFHAELSSDLFRRPKQPFMGKLELARDYKSLHSVIKAVEENDFIMKRRKNDEILDICLRKFLKDSMKGRTEGVWMNPTVSQACLKHFGIPREYFRADRKLVSDYNQMIFQIDGSDKARTLGMHRDRDENDKPVNTILGCVSGDGGKDVILWKPNEGTEDMPRWWRNEGMSRESFELAKIQCYTVPEIASKVLVFTIDPGDFIFMPKNTYHWVCPSDHATWTVMVTSSTY